MSNEQDIERWRSRMENKLDDMAEAIIRLARMEERMVTLFNRMDQYDELQAKVIKRLSEIEKANIGQSLFFRALDKGAWLCVGALIVYYINNGGGHG